MAFSLLTRNYDITLANSVVTITNKWTGLPATIVEGPQGGVLNTQGAAKLNAQAGLNVYLDDTQEWVVKVLDGLILEYNVDNPKQLVAVTDFTTLNPKVGVTYVLNQPPYTEYTWDGLNLVSNLTSAQVNMVQSLSDVTLNNVVKNIDGKVVSYVKNGVEHFISYPDAFTYVFSNTTGTVKTVTVDAQGYVISIV
jgi:hypothetical protein